MYSWHQADDNKASQLAEGRLTESTAGGKRIGLLKQNNIIFAFSATCPHSGAALCGGWLDARGRIVCPLHQYRFDPANGRNTSGEGYKLRTYKVEVKEDSIFIGLIADTNDAASPLP